MVSPVNSISDPFWAYFSAMRQELLSFSGVRVRMADEPSFPQTLSYDEKGHLRATSAAVRAPALRPARHAPWIRLPTIGRFRRIVPFSALTREQLSLILRSTLLSQYTNEFQLEGKELVVSESVLDRVVDESLRKETGARALEASLMRYLEEAAFEAFSEPSARRVSLSVREGRIVHDNS